MSCYLNDKEISSIISMELKNPHLTGLISVTKVKTTPDLNPEFGCLVRLIGLIV